MRAASDENRVRSAGGAEAHLVLVGAGVGLHHRGDLAHGAGILQLVPDEGAQALAQVDKQYIDVRKNMERLRALRLAKEAEDALNPPVVVAKKKKAGPKKAPAEVADSEPETVGED